MAAGLKDRLARQVAGQTHLSFDPIGQDEPTLASLPCRLIDPDPNQPRRDLGKLDELAESIRAQGLIQPLIVEPLATGRYRILAGERRYMACRQLGLETVPCIARMVAVHSRLALQLIENLHRKDLNPVEEARRFQRLMEEFNLSQRDLAQRLGRSLAAVNQTLRILDLGEEILRDVQTSEHATKSLLLEIAKESDPAQQQALWAKAQGGKLTVRAARSANHGRESGRTATTVWTLLLADAKVEVRFQEGEATSERAKAALQRALEHCGRLECK